jgi:hypothetical protein
MKQRVIFKVTFIILYFSCFLSCKKFVSIDPPKNQAERAIVFENESAATSATVGLYSQLMQTSLSLASAGTTIYPGLSADEIYNTAPSTDYDAYRSNEVPENSSSIARLWHTGYRNIYHANSVIEGLDRSNTLSDTLRKKLKGEVLVTRAFLYGILTNLFGDIPLVLSTDFQHNQSVSRMPVAEIYQQIISDLISAKGLLKESYPTAGRIRPNKWTAAGLLARAYLYTGNWAAAEQESTELINSGLYTLPANLNNVFLTTSTEAIWQLSPVLSTINTAEGNLFNPATATARPTFVLTPTLLSAFEPNDLRKTNWTKTVTVSGLPYTYPFKYKVRTGAPPYNEYNMCLRLAEIFLVRAEARAMQNNIDGAKDDINRVRTRAGLTNTTANTQSTILNAIEQERRIELMTEFGHRWFDLKRTGRADMVLAPVKPASWSATDMLYPLPLYELETNPALFQNPGY